MKKYFIIFTGILFVNIYAAPGDLCASNECRFGSKCYKKDQGYTPADKCVLLECQGQAQTKKSWCEDIPAPPGCTSVAERLGKPYPECCASFNCPASTGNYTGQGVCDLVDGCFFEGKCYTKGQRFTVTYVYCYEMTCRGYNQTSIAMCPILSVNTNCKTIDWSPGPYPECCPKAICPKSN